MKRNHVNPQHENHNSTLTFFLTLVYPENTNCFITKLLSMYLMEQHGLVMDLKQSNIRKVKSIEILNYCRITDFLDILFNYIMA